MKLIILIITTCLLQVSAAGFGQKVTIVGNGITLPEVFKEMRMQTGYSILWQPDKVDGKKKLNLNIKDQLLSYVLDQVLKGEHLGYSIDDKTIRIKYVEPSIMDKVSDFIKRWYMDVKLRILDEKGNPLVNVTVKIKDSNTRFVTDANGELTLNSMSSDAVLQISFIGYATQEIKVADIKSMIVIRMQLLNNDLKEVQILTNGYQKIPKERATGSFEVIDSALFNRVTSTNFINRLEGLSPSLLFINKDNPNVPKAQNRIRIRTESSIITLNPPLIVLDNFPYDGDLENINPNDIQDITLLKDAAAASIWGIRASRGVIVITTKKGKFNQPLSIDFNSNVTIGSKPDLFAMRELGPKDYMELEKIIFDKGMYDYDLDPANIYSPIAVSPAVQTYYQLRENQIDQATADKKLAELSKHDLRDDMLKYVYRPSINQQYALNVNGGGDKATYSVSGGYDNNRGNIIGSDYNRFTVKTSTLLKPLDKLEVQASLSFSTGTNKETAAMATPSLDYRLFRSFLSKRPYAYLRLADDMGNPLVYDEFSYRKSWLNGINSEITNGKLQSWDYNPLGEQDSKHSSLVSQDVVINVGSRYQVFPWLSAGVDYQFQKNNQQSELWMGMGAIDLRSNINAFSSWPGGILKRAIPLGDQIRNMYDNTTGHTVRGQLNINKDFGDDHTIAMIAGVERKQIDAQVENFNRFGVDSETLFNQLYNLNQLYPLLNGNWGNGKIQDFQGNVAISRRNVSVYSNLGYTFLGRYTASASFRKDASNELGLKTRWSPLWSTGLAWNISKENFYKWSAMPELKLRTTFGYNGNVSSITSSEAIIRALGPDYYTGLPASGIDSPPNPSLTFEKVSQLNVALDFASANNRITGTIEGYIKKGQNIIIGTLIDPSTGFNSARSNGANTKGKGVEITLNTNNLGRSAFEWNTTILFTYNKTIVSKHLGTKLTADLLINNPQQNPIAGRDAYAVYAYKFAGLDPETGDPMGYFNGAPSKNYIPILYPTNFNPDSLRYFGSVYPIYTGVLRNTFGYKGVSLSVSLSGKFKYFFKRYSMSYSNFIGYGESNIDFNKRWQKPGDEKTTNIPSFGDDSFRNQFYNQSEVMVEPGDHIRLQDIVLNYNVPVKIKRLRNVRLYANAQNLNVIVWRKNKQGIDPEYGNFWPTPRTIAFGAAANF